MAKKKKGDTAKEEADYEFRLPAFDEQAFIRREVASAKASFWTIGLGFLLGLAALGVTVVAPGLWQVGWLILAAGMLALKPLLQRLGFPEDVTTTKALIGSYFMLFFTGLAVWILGVNFV